LRVIVGDGKQSAELDRWPVAAFDKTLSLIEHLDRSEKREEIVEGDSFRDASDSTELSDGSEARKSHPARALPANRFYLRSPEVWDDVLVTIGAAALRR
jgi:hypothetical protein